MDQLIGELNAKTGWDVPIHVDAASGGKTVLEIFERQAPACVLLSCARPKTASTVKIRT